MNCPPAPKTCPLLTSPSLSSIRKPLPRGGSIKDKQSTMAQPPGNENLGIPPPTSQTRYWQNRPPVDQHPRRLTLPSRPPTACPRTMHREIELQPSAFSLQPSASSLQPNLSPAPDKTTQASVLAGLVWSPACRPLHKLLADTSSALPKPPCRKRSGNACGEILDVFHSDRLHCVREPILHHTPFDNQYRRHPAADRTQCRNHDETTHHMMCDEAPGHC